MRHLKKAVWPHCVPVNSDLKSEIHPIEEWLGEQLGPEKDEWICIYQHNRTDFYFRDGQDATLFALKWT